MIAEAAKAKAALQSMSDAAKAEGAVEAEAAAKAAAAHKLDTAAIKDERRALEDLAAGAKRAQQWTAWGGRTDPGAYMADLARTLEYKRLINIQNWMGFSTPQAAYAFRERERLQALEMNKAVWGGYTTPDQYLGYLQKQRTELAGLNSALVARAQLYRENADAALSYANALAGTHKSAGQLGENVDLTGINQFQAALSGLPDVVSTRLNVDDAVALGKLAQYMSLLRGIPRMVSTSEVLTAATTLGGTALDQPKVVPVSYGGPYQEQFAAIMAEVAQLSRLRAQIPVHFELPSAAEVAAFVSQIPTAGITEPVHLAPDGGSVGVGPGPPPQVIAAWNALSGAESAATTQARLAGTAEVAAGNDAARAAAGVGAAARAWEALSAAEKTARMDAALGPLPGGGGAGKPPTPPPVAPAPGAEPPDDAAGKWAALAGAEKLAGDAAGAAEVKQSAVGAAVGKAIPLLASAATGWGGLGAKLSLFAGVFGAGALGAVAAWHLVLDVIIELVAILVPSITTLVAGLTAFGIVGSAAAQQVQQRLQATRVAADATGQAIYPLTGQLQAMQDAARPQVWQLYGDMLTIVGNKAGIFSKLATDTGNTLDRMAAKVTVWATGASKGLSTFFAVGTHDLQGLGQFFSNLGNAFMNLIKVTQQTHIDQFFLDFLIVLSKFLDLVTKLPTPVLAAALALHAIWLYGGLAATIIASLLGPLRALALAMGAVDAASVGGGLASLGKDASGAQKLNAVIKDISAGVGNLGAGLASLGPKLAAVFTNPVTWALALAAAVAVIAVKVGTAKDATQQWIDKMNSSLGSSSMFTVIGRTVANLAAVTQQLSDKQNLNAQAAHELSAAQTDLSGKLSNELVHVGDISRAYGVSMPTALALLNTAGVKTSALFTDQSKVWAAAEQQVAGLVKGYAAMGQGLTQLQGDVSVQLVVGSDQLKQMQQLNTAWDTWLTTVTGGQTAFVTFQQNLATTTTRAKAAGAGLGGLSANSLTLRASYDQLIPQAGTVLDQIRQQSAVLQNGAAGSALLTRATKDLAAEMMPLARNNDAARASLLAVVQEADPAVNTWQKLTVWMGGHAGAAKSAKDLNDIMTILERPVSNLAADAAKLTTTLQSDLNPAMAQATFNAWGGQKAFSTFATDLQKFGPGSQVTIKAGQTVAQMLLSIDKNSGQAHDQFVAWAMSMGMGKDAASKLWTEVSKGEKPMANMRDGLAQSATQANNLAKSGLWAQMRDLTATGLSQIGTFFSKTIPADAAAMGKSITGAFDVANAGFKRDLSVPVDHWFGSTIPSDAKAMGSTLAGAWATVSQGFLRDVGGPVANFFSKTIPSDASAMAGSLAGDWKSFWSGFMAQFGSPIANFFTKTVPGYFSSVGSTWLSNVKGMWHNFSGDVVGNLEHTFLTLVPGWFAGTGVDWKKTSGNMWKDFDGQLVQPAQTFFTKTIPAWFNDVTKWWSGTWSGNMKSFQNEIINPFTNFFTKTIPAWFNDISKWWSDHWSANMKSFQNEIINPFLNFFTKTVPGWFGDVGKWWSGLWTGNMKMFDGNVIGGFSNFFTKTIPGWFNNVGKWWSNLWSSNMKDFSSHVITPIENWFSTTMPNALKNGMRAGIDWVINNVINKTIGFINNDILSHLPGGLKISTVSQVAAGGDIPSHASGRAIRMPGSGSIPGTGDEDGTHIIAMGGEYMLRKPARMALERTYGSNFLNTLNQADSWLNAGSRGNAASQRPPSRRRYASGGDVNPIGRGLRPERIDMGVDYGGAGPLYALNHGTITNLYNSGWPGGGFIGLRLDKGPEAGKYWFYAEDVAPLTNIGATVNAGQHIANATGGRSGIEVGFAAPPGSGTTMAAATGESAAGQKAGDPGRFSTGWGVAASNLIASLGGPRGILQPGGIQGGTPGVAGGFGFLQEIWQTVEGLLNSAGNGLGDLIKPLGKFVAGGAGELLKLARQGSTAIFNAIWDHSVKPLVGEVPGDTIPGAILQAGAADIKQGIDVFMSGQDSTAQASAAASNAAISAGAPGPGGGNAAANAALARKLYPAWGSGTEWLAWNALEMAEAGWNQFARNPSSGAYGIPQALPPSKMGAAANPPQSNPTAQIRWMHDYIAQVYGDPIGANRHENMFHWYAGGGPVGGDGATMAVWPGFAQGDVISAIESSTGNSEIREAMALGSYLESGWNDTAVGDAGTSFGPYQIHLPAHPGVTKAEAENAAWATKYMLPAYTSGVNAVSSSVWSSNPETAAETAAYKAERPAQTYFASHGTAAVNAAWNKVRAALGGSAGTTPGISGSSSSSVPSVAPKMAYSGISVPDITGHQAGPAHNMLVAAGLVPTAAAGQRPYWYATGSAPPPDSAATEGMSVTILADPSAAAKPVRVPDLKDYTAGTAHDILAAAGFIPTAASGQKAWWKVTGTSPAAGAVATPGSKVTILATASIVQVPSLAGYQAGAAHDALVAAGLVPVAAAGQRAFWYVTGTSPRAGALVAPGTRVTILADPAAKPGGIGAAANWPAASAALSGAVDKEVGAFWAMNAAPVKGATKDQWASWYADLGILQHQQGSVAGSWNTISPLLSSPAGLTTNDWVNFGESISTELSWLYDRPSPPSSVWGWEKNVPWPAGFRTSAGKAPGQIPPSGWAAWKYAHPQWSSAIGALQTLKNDEGAAYGAWESLYGPAGSITNAPPTPGLQVVPAGGGPITVNLEPLIPGGPAFPVMAQSGQSLSSSGSGFAAGGGLDDITGMFALGGVTPSGPAAMPPQMSQSLASGGATEMPRTMAPAAGGAGGDRVGVKVGSLTINNAVPERPSDSITRSTNRLAFLAGRGMA